MWKSAEKRGGGGRGEEWKILRCQEKKRISNMEMEKESIREKRDGETEYD